MVLAGASIPVISIGGVVGLILGLIVGRLLFNRFCPESNNKNAKVFAELQAQHEAEEEEEPTDKEPEAVFPKGGYIKNGRYVPNKVPHFTKIKKDKKRGLKQSNGSGKQGKKYEVENVGVAEKENAENAVVVVAKDEIVDEQAPRQVHTGSRESARQKQQPRLSRKRPRAGRPPQGGGTVGVDTVVDMQQPNTQADQLLRTGAAAARKGSANNGNSDGKLPVHIQAGPSGRSSKPVYRPHTTLDDGHRQQKQEKEGSRGGGQETKRGNGNQEAEAVVFDSVAKLREQKFKEARVKVAKELKERREMEQMQAASAETYARIEAKEQRGLGPSAAPSARRSKSTTAKLTNEYKPPSFEAAKARTRAAVQVEIAAQRLASQPKKKKGGKRRASKR